MLNADVLGTSILSLLEYGLFCLIIFSALLIIIYKRKKISFQKDFYTISCTESDGGLIWAVVSLVSFLVAVAVVSLVLFVVAAAGVFF
jgi:hypothetical protein